LKRVLVTYSTFSGSTPEVAKVIGEELRATAQVEVRPMSDVRSFEGFDAVVIGGPMILGWHQQARGFLRRHRRALEHIPLAIFVTAMSLTDTGETAVDGVPIVVDPRLAKLPQRLGRLSFKERYARLTNYLRPILHSARPARPRTIGVFAGRLEYGRLPWYAVVFVMVFLKAPAGDRRNWEAIRAWAAMLRSHFELD
jgi:menaquinone-dependent protoporphyrinogen IX oxidase